MNVKLYSLVIPLKTNFQHTKANHDFARNLVFKIHYKDCIGLGECVPRNYVTNESVSSVIETVTNINLHGILSNICWVSPSLAIQSLLHIDWPSYFDVDKNMNVLCLLDLALFDLIGQYFKYPVSTLINDFIFGGASQDNLMKTVQTMDYSLSVHDFLQRSPFHHIKVKVGGSLDDDIAKIREIRQQVDSSVTFSVDANMAWTLAQAIESINRLSECGIDWCEEPIKQKDFYNYRLLRGKTTLPIMLDESIYLLSDLNCAIKENACNSINIRLSKCGGLAQSINLIKVARKNNIKYQLGAQVAEAGPLVAAARHLSLCLDDKLAYEAGQIDRFFFHPIVTPTPLVNRNTNCAQKLDGNGLGIKLNKNFYLYIDKFYTWETISGVLMRTDENTIASTQLTYYFDKGEDKQLIRPNILRGKVIQIDPISGIIVSTANKLFQSLELADESIGVVVSTKITHKKMIVDFVNSVHAHHPSPSQFASSALNASASMVALALELNGPTVTLCGRAAESNKAYTLAQMYIQRGDANIILLLEAYLINNTQLNCHAYAIT